MTSKQRAYLRSLATSLQPIFQIGKSEISENMTEQISNALEARELIKIHVLKNSFYTPGEAGEILAEATDSELVTVIGNKLVLYRRSEKNPRIEL